MLLLLLLLLLFLLLLSLLLLLSSMMILVIGFTCPPTIHFKNYYKVRQLFHYKLRHVLSQSAIGITKCGRTLHEWIINLLVLYMYSSYTPRPPSVQKNSNSSSGLLLMFIALVFLTLIFNTSLLQLGPFCNKLDAAFSLMTLRGQGKGHHGDESYSKESFLPDKPTSWLKCYKAPSRLKQALTFPAKLPFLFSKITFHLNFQNDISQTTSEQYPMMHFSRSITQYRNHGRLHGEIRPFSRRIFSHLCSSKRKKIALFCYLTGFLRFAMAQERNIHIETFIFIVSAQSSYHKVFSDPQQGHEYSRFFGLYVEVFQMWTSRQQIEVLNIVQAKKYPEVPTF